MSEPDLDAAARAVHELLRALGHDPADNPELADTGRRVAEALHRDLLAGHRVQVGELLRAGLCEAEGPSGLVVVRDLAVATLCPHHLMPALGTASVAYLPGTQVVGLGTLAALVDACARRLTLQESIGASVVDALMQHAGATGAWCRLSLVHACLAARGERQAGARVDTTAVRGDLDTSAGRERLALALGGPA